MDIGSKENVDFTLPRNTTHVRGRLGVFLVSGLDETGSLLTTILSLLKSRYRLRYLLIFIRHQGLLQHSNKRITSLKQ